MNAVLDGPATAQPKPQRHARLWPPLARLVFSPAARQGTLSLIDQAVANLLTYYTVKDIEEQEPRVKVVSVVLKNDERNKLTVQLGYKDRNDQNEKINQIPVTFDKQG